MTQTRDLAAEIAALKTRCAELEGLSLATGVILTQLLQKICMREFDPQGAASRIVGSAREAIEAFTAAVPSEPAMKARALEAVDQYEEQIRSVLRV